MKKDCNGKVNSALKKQRAEVGYVRQQNALWQHNVTNALLKINARHEEVLHSRLKKPVILIPNLDKFHWEKLNKTKQELFRNQDSVQLSETLKNECEI